MTRMFTVNDKPMKTWNVFTGCLFNCSYCWARKLVEDRLKDTPKYRECGFKPTFHEKELHHKFKPGDFVFVAAMGDISFAEEDELSAILNVIEVHTSTKFLLQSKDPRMFSNGKWPENVYLGTTIETNRGYSVGNAPSHLERGRAFKKLLFPHKFLSIEPLMDFDFEILTEWVMDIHPEIVEIGYDNYKCGLLEPSLEKTLALISALRKKGIQVIEKHGLRSR